MLESDVYDITHENIGEKFKEHFYGILKYVKSNDIKNAKITTRIRELTTKEIIIFTDIEETLKNFEIP